MIKDIKFEVHERTLMQLSQIFKALKGILNSHLISFSLKIQHHAFSAELLVKHYAPLIQKISTEKTSRLSAVSLN